MILALALFAFVVAYTGVLVLLLMMRAAALEHLAKQPPDDDADWLREMAVTSLHGSEQ